MPTSQHLDGIHHELMDIARECTKMYHREFSEDEVRKLQDRVQVIDEKYKQGVINEKDEDYPEENPYEQPGQAEVAEELEKVHNSLRYLLTRVKQ
ncbi:hypothetical protein EC973_001703 [Apophysomyces ossiformis]|uniref:Uncharacterized protein n=1 Tax=Apophysomyces ossiformis TaxID=679940 RepID=A0A8H7BLM6_9FUNG|nr:hypothetical protein EC973_001703 [Apophysomyces ossiformis]